MLSCACAAQMMFVGPDTARQRRGVAGLPAFPVGRLLAACALVLAGCAPLPEVTEVRQVKVPIRVPVVVVEPADEAARHVLRYAERVRTLQPPELQAEIARIGDPAGAPAASIELALVLGQMRGPGDTGKAIAALETLLRSTAPEAAVWQPLARLLLPRFTETKRLEEQIEKQNQQLRDSQRRLDQLNEKLEAVKAIERSLGPRSSPAPAPGIPGGKSALP
ncbi:hypothetical protein AAW51_2874 [Caldimonas brevitalea]|uniref:Uncharacterized protein n=1 Tax=Caldimonas brevitalea TaxID=413882 RepID=A0A0G3BSP1_9BURK|nr:hypothetical protein AAW51_2874 [Caldimonas brevitalea]